MGIRLHFGLVPVQVYNALNMTPQELELALLLDKMEALRFDRRVSVSEEYQCDPTFVLYEAGQRIEQEMTSVSRYRRLVDGEIGKVYPDKEWKPADFDETIKKEYGYTSIDQELILNMINKAYTEDYLDSVEWITLISLYKANPSSVKMYWC